MGGFKKEIAGELIRLIKKGLDITSDVSKGIMQGTQSGRSQQLLHAKGDLKFREAMDKAESIVTRKKTLKKLNKKGKDRNIAARGSLEQDNIRDIKSIGGEGELKKLMTRNKLVDNAPNN